MVSDPADELADLADCIYGALGVQLEHLDASEESHAGRCAVGEYLSGFEGRAPNFTDTTRGAGVIIDRSASTPIGILQQPWSIHAYHATESYIDSKLRTGAWGLL